MGFVKSSAVVKTSLVTAFTIAAALIWKDVIVEFIELVVPSGQTLIYKVIAALFATVLIIIAIYVVLQTEYEAKHIAARLKKNK